MSARATHCCAFGILTLLCLGSVVAAQGKPDIRWMRGGHSFYLTKLVHSSDGSFFASAAQDNTIKIWRGSDDLLLRTLLVPGGAGALALSPDNNTICADGHIPDLHPFIRCWRVADGAELWTSVVPGTIPHDAVDGLAFSPDGQRLASGLVNKAALSIWRASDGVYLTDFTGPSPFFGLGGISYSPDGLFLATNTADLSRLVLLNPASGGLIWDSGVVGTSFGYDIAFSPDSQLVATVNGVGAHVVGTSDHLWRPFPLGTPALRVAFSPNGTRLASGSTGGGLNLWNTSTGALIRSWDGHGSPSASPLTPVTFNADSARMLSGRLDIKRWNASNGNFAALVTGQVGPVRLLALSANGQVVATATSAPSDIDEHVISLFRASDGALLRYIEYGSQGLRGLALSPDSQHVAAADTNGLRTWNVGTGALEHAHAESGRFSAWRPLAYTPDGTAIAESGDDMFTVSLWNPATDALTPIVAGPARALQFLPDGRLVVAQANLVEVVTLAGVIVRSMTDSSNVNALAVSADGSTIAAGGVDAAYAPPHVARIWRVSDGAPLQTLVGHTTYIDGIAFAWDGRTVATGAQDSTVRIWRASDGSQLRLYDEETFLTRGHSIDGVWSLVGSTRSSRFAYGRGDATVVMADNPEAAPLIMTFNVPSEVTGCKTASAKIVLDRPAPPAGVAVSIGSTSPDVSVPSVVTIKGGTTQKSFKIATTPVAAPETATITATLGANSTDGILGIRPIGVSTLTLTPTAVTGGNSVAGALRLECAAGPGDVLVNLSSSLPSVAQPTVAGITIPAGTKDGIFDVTTVPVSAVKKPKITAATSSDALRKSKTLTVNP